MGFLIGFPNRGLIALNCYDKEFLLISGRAVSLSPEDIWKRQALVRGVQEFKNAKRENRMSRFLFLTMKQPCLIRGCQAIPLFNHNFESRIKSSRITGFKSTLLTVDWLTLLS